MSPAIPKCQFSALTMHKNLLQKKNCKGKWIYDQAELDPIIYLGGEKKNKQAACQNSNYLKDLMPRRNSRYSSPWTAMQSQGTRGQAFLKSDPVMTGSVKDPRIDARGNPTLTAIKPKVTPFNNTSCYIPPNYQPAN